VQDVPHPPQGIFIALADCKELDERHPPEGRLNQRLIRNEAWNAARGAGNVPDGDRATAEARLNAAAHTRGDSIFIHTPPTANQINKVLEAGVACTALRSDVSQIKMTVGVDETREQDAIMPGQDLSL
jgi:hypothetical protein